MAEIRGRKIDLPGGRSVFVGHRVAADFSEDVSYYIQFKNGTTINRWRLTPEAVIALRRLTAIDGPHGDPQTFEIEEKPGDSGHWRWQTVTEKDA